MPCKDLCRRCYDISYKLACELVRARDILLTETASTGKQNLPSNTLFDRPWSVSTGFSGIAVSLAYQAKVHAQPQFLEAAIDLLDGAVASLPLNYPPNWGLLDGLTGICFSARFVDPRLQNFGPFVAGLDSQIFEATLALSSLLKTSDLLSYSAFDLVSGLSGLTRYWLYAAPSEFAEEGLNLCLPALSDLFLSTSWPPRWHTPARLIPDRTLARSYPGGIANIGLAHGCAGPLSVLSACKARGAVARGSDEAIATLANLLLQVRKEDEYGPYWTTVVSVDPASYCDATKPAWCYGTAGVARAVWLAGVSMEQECWKQVALQAMVATQRRQIPFDELIFCHGSTGLFHIARTFASEQDRVNLDQLTQKNLLKIIDEIDQRLVTDEQRIKYPLGFLEGLAGIAAVIAAASSPEVPTWDALFSLS